MSAALDLLTAAIGLLIFCEGASLLRGGYKGWLGFAGVGVGLFMLLAAAYPRGSA